LKDYLKRLEIGADNKEYFCFVYALVQLGGVSQEIIKKINSRCFGGYLSQMDVVGICDEFELDIQIIVCETTMHTEVIRKGKSGSIMYYMNHWFVNEKTRWSKRELCDEVGC
jgi:hypothetical protein